MECARCGKQWADVRRNGAGRTLLLATAVVLIGLTGRTIGEEPAQSDDPESAQPVDVDSLVVSLQEGADSPRAAVTAFAAAAAAGDVEAALALIDPEVRTLIETEVLLEEYILNTFLLRNVMMTEEQRKSPWNNLGAIPVVSAKRDLLRTHRIDVKGERPSAREGVRILDADWIVRAADSYPPDRPLHSVPVSTVVVQRDCRWFLFQPFGTVLMWLIESREYFEERRRNGPDQATTSIIEFQKEVLEDGNPIEMVFRAIYHVPVEVVHGELSLAAQTEEADKLLQDVKTLIRFYSNLRNRVHHGDISDLEELERLLEPGERAWESLLDRYAQVYLPAIKAVHAHVKPAADPPGEQ